VLLVNALDARKNLSGIADVLLLAHAVTPVQVDVVGQARIANRAVADFFTRLTNAGIAAHWHREATDATLNALYRTASVLLFPSLYEGLGLPVLEAQQAGMPAITTDTASLPEINLNPSLCFASEDIAGMAQALSDVVAERCTVLRGEPLRAALAKRFSVQVSSSEALAA
jgi:glycosyltransferase involved in cell wall biosynthesis